VAEISARAVKELRDRTGVGMMDCKRALNDAGGDAEKAVELLRERGLAKAGKREGRATSEGVIALKLDGPVGSLIELNCETDFVARTGDFSQLAESLAGVVAASESAATPEALLQASVDGVTVSDRITAAMAKLGENVVIKRVSRLSVNGPGLVGGYTHAGSKLGALVAAETAGSGPEFESLVRDLAMHVAAADPAPLAVSRDGLSADLLEAERVIYRKQAEQSGKPEKVIERIVEGKINKFASEVCLLEQAFVKDPDRSVAERVREAGEKGGAEVSVVGFERFRLGER
jgi:elongation factor Ts